ncbi:MAG TPA: hypothetical protein PLJ21_08260 [Pseudobdellovibrionaceae bacterium]|nr:hypothetical protein [Pseudobdellovibrionaceae bacterium]
MGFEFSKKGKREISSFVAEGLLYEHSLGLLDSERERATQNFLKNSRDAQVELEKIQRAQFYLKKLNEISIHEEILSEIKQRSSLKNKIRHHLNIENWSALSKWSVEGVLVAGIMSLLLYNIPWGPLIHEKIWSKETQLILAEVKNIKTNVEPIEVGNSPIYSDSEEGAEKNIEKKAEPVTEIVKSTSELKKIEPPIVVAQEGEIYRANFMVSNLSPESEALAKSISSMGGRRAGSVDLGWMKNKGTSYFHFTIPTAQLESLRAELLKYGKIQLNKERHPRIMPEGITRIIIEVHQNPKTETTPPEAQ